MSEKGVVPIEENHQVKISVMFYGSIASNVGKKSLELLVPKGETVGVFLDTLSAAAGNRLGELLHGYGLSLLLNGKTLDISDPGRILLESDEDAAEVTVCLLPMIAGGS